VVESTVGMLMNLGEKAEPKTIEEATIRALE